MKNFINIATALCVIMSLAMTSPALSQRHSIPESLIGADLKQAQEAYLKEINRGVDSLTLPYAEALFYDGQLEKSLDMFRKADSLGLEMNLRQQRNFSHLARRMGQTSPYDKETGYFSTEWQPLVRTESHCSNSAYQEFGPFAWNDILFFSSSRKTPGRRSAAKYAFTQQPFLNIYAIDQDCRPIPTDFLPPLNTSLHDGPLAISEDTTLVIITRNYQRPSDEGKQNLYLDLYIKENGEWNNDMAFQFNDPSYSVQHPYYHDKTKTLYFSSNMPGGQGGFDLYKTKWNGQEWSEAVNLGPDINSEYDEVFPSLSPDGNLIYATNHIESPGGLSLVKYKNNTKYLFPEPINSQYDDYSITFADETSGFFSTNRQQEPFGDNIYFFELIPMPFIILAKDSESRRPVQGVKVDYKATDPKLEGQTLTTASGEATVYEGFESPFRMEIELSRDGYKSLSKDSEDFVRIDNRWIMEFDMEAEPVEPPLHPAIARAKQDGYFILYFDNDQPDPASWQRTTQSSYLDAYKAYMERRTMYNRESLNPRQQLNHFFELIEEGFIQLEWFASFLKSEAEQGKSIEVEFSSHASPIARESYNMILSERRFVSVKNFLLSWEGGVLNTYKQQGLIGFNNISMGSSQADPDVSADRDDPARSIFSVEAARERKVRVTW